MDRSGKPIVAVGLPGDQGMVAAQRAASVIDNVVVVAEHGVSTPPGVEAVGVEPGKARVGRAVREAVRRDAWWVVVPADVGAPEYVLGSAIRSVAKTATEDHPGVALLAASPRTTWPYRRILAVVDPLGPDSSGLAAWITMGLARRTGAQIDILAVGVPAGAPMGTREARLSYLPIGRRDDLLRLAITRLDEFDIAPTWIPGGAGVSAVDAVKAAVAGGSYDVVVDDLGGTRIRKRVGKKRSVQRLLEHGEVGAVPVWALEHAGCDVVTVIDAVSLGMVPAGVLRTGAVAAMTMGLLGVSATAMAAPTAQPAAATTTVAEAGAEQDKKDSKDTKDTKKGETKAEQSVDSQLDQANAWVAEVSDDVSLEQYERGMAEVDQAQQDKTKAQQAHGEDKADLKKDEKQEAKAEKSLTQLEAEVEPTADELAEARVEVGEATADLAEAEQELEAATKDASGLTGILPGGATQEDVEAAEADVAQAEQAVADAHAAEAALYEEYLHFAEDVEAAEAELAAASDEVAASQAAVTKSQAEAQAAKELAAGYEELGAELEEAFRSQGLVRPATGEVTSEFGMRVHPVTGEYKLHTGVDFTGDDGNFYAAADGTVSYAGYDSAYGYMVKVDHGMVEGHHVETWYAHMPGLEVSVGDEVDAGEVIGGIGNTGYSTGPHAHFELRVDGNPVDPMPYMR